MTLEMSERQRSVYDLVSEAPPALASTPAMEPVWQSSTRYADQPMSLGTRLFGMGGVTLVALLILGGAFFTWTTHQAVEAPPTLNVFDVAPPASPPEPQSEIPPGPEQDQKEKPQPAPVQPKIEPPEIRIVNDNPIVFPAAKPVSDPGPPVEKTTTPESKPLPPAPQQSNAKPTWEGLVLGALNKAKRYPRNAQFRREQGVPYIRFVMNREGRVLSSALERSSGFRSLDDEAVSLPRRAQPLPKPPDSVLGDTIELVVPVEYFLSQR